MRRYLPVLLAVFLAASAVSPAFAEKKPAEEIISEQWMEVRMLGSKIGFAYQKMVRTETGYILTAKSVMKLEISETTQDISTSRTYFLDSNMKPLRFSYMQKMLNHRQFFEGVVEGNKLKMTIKSGGNVTKKTLPFEADTNLADTLNFLIGKSRLKEGLKFSFKIFIEPLLTTETISVEVGKLVDMEFMGKNEKVWEVKSQFKSFTATSYITPEGRLLKETSLMGIESIAVSEKQAVSFSEGIMPFTNLLAFSLITTDVQIKGQENLSSVRLKISGLRAKNLIPSDGRQKVTLAGEREHEGKVIYTVDLNVQKENQNDIPEIQRPMPAVGMSEYLRATFEAQSDDPLIVARAKKIVGKEPDAYRAAVKINRWVYKNLDKKFIDTFSAVATLKALEGECQSHTNLFAALAKSSGIPVRTVSGIVYSRQFNGFLYHAWPEVYVGKWIAMDPTFGQDIADPTHIKLVEGDLSKQLQLFEFIGKIGIDIVSTEQDS